MLEKVYDVFARKDRGDQLVHIGYVDAMDDEIARVHAWTTYDEEKWFEMCVVERAAIIPVNRDDGPFAKARRAGDGAGTEGAVGFDGGRSEDGASGGSRRSDDE